MSGLVNGVCLNLNEEKILLVKGLDNKRYKLPGGMQEPGEDHIDAMIREWEEEVGHERKQIMLCELKCRIIRNNGNGNYPQYLFWLEVKNPERIRPDGIPGENGPPEWVFLKDIVKGKVTLYPSYLKALRLVLKKMATERKELAFLANELDY